MAYFSRLACKGLMSSHLTLRLFQWLVCFFQEFLLWKWVHHWRERLDCNTAGLPFTWDRSKGVTSRCSLWVQAEWLYRHYVSKSIIIPKEFELQSYILKSQADGSRFPAFDAVLQLCQIWPWGGVWGKGTRISLHYLCKFLRFYNYLKTKSVLHIRLSLRKG